MINNFLTINWRLIILFGVLLFAWFLWPTIYGQPFAQANFGRADNVLRVNRITGELQCYWWKDGKWRVWNEANYEKNK